MESKFMIKGVSRRDKLLFEKENNVIGIFKEPIPDGAFGEPTTFVLAVTFFGLQVLAAYLLRKHSGESFEETIIEEFPDGRKVTRIVKWKKHKSEAPEKEVVEAIMSAKPIIDNV